MPITITHIIENAGDKRTLCDERKFDGAYVVARFVGAHQRGHGLIVCAECKAIAERDGISLEESEEPK